MCGRYSLTTPVEALRALFGFPERPNLAPRANIAPTQDVAALRLGAAGDGGETGGGAEPGRRFVWLRWGLIPAWAKDLAIGNRLINARAEGVAEKPAFRAAFRKRRCLILADGFYEWRKEAGRRQPYRITLPEGGPFAFAGLWERWTAPPGGPAAAERIESCTIITTEANALLRPLHNRMPVILDPAALAAWLDPETPPDEARALLRPDPGAAMTLYRVSPRINDAANDDPALIAPIEAPEAP
ncbi:MAG: SOS response-associated peptidase, partial [Kiloniellaceae bacterium]